MTHPQRILLSFVGLSLHYLGRSDASNSSECGLHHAEMSWELQPVRHANLTVMHAKYHQEHQNEQCLPLLILVIAKDNNSWGRNRGFVHFLQLLLNLTQQAPDVQLSLGLLVSDATAYTDLRCSLAHASKAPDHLQICNTSRSDPRKAAPITDCLQKLKMQQVLLLHSPDESHLANLTENTKRSTETQMLRRRGLARLRNQLLIRAMCEHCRALGDEDAVLWIDSDIISAPQEMLPKMIASSLDIITPNCYFQDTSWPRWRQKLWYFDYNVFQALKPCKAAHAGSPLRPSPEDIQQIAAGAAFPQKSKTNRHGHLLFLDELEKSSEEFVELTSVGGTMLFVRTKVHRDGVLFPVANIIGSEWDRQGYLGLETEGICWVAKFLGYKCWGMPHSTIMHDAI